MNCPVKCINVNCAALHIAINHRNTSDVSEMKENGVDIESIIRDQESLRLSTNENKCAIHLELSMKSASKNQAIEKNIHQETYRKTVTMEKLQYMPYNK